MIIFREVVVVNSGSHTTKPRINSSEKNQDLFKKCYPGYILLNIIPGSFCSGKAR